MIVKQKQHSLLFVAIGLVGCSIVRLLLTKTSILPASIDDSIDHHIHQIEEGQEYHESAASGNDVVSTLMEELKELVQDNKNHDPILNCSSPLVPFKNRFVVDPAQQHQSIPRILHISHRSRCVGRDLNKILNRWKQAFPNYSIVYHDDTAVEKLLHQDWPEFPNLHRIFPCLLSGAMKSDVWRILVLYKYGGIYTDADNIPLGLNESHIEPTVSALFLTDPFSRPSQNFMAMQAGHPIANITMHTMIDNVLKVENIATQRVVFVTGPHALKTGYQLFMQNQPDIFGYRRKDPLFHGMQNLTVRKINKNVEKYFAVKQGWDDVVVYNATHNVTRRQRWDLENGVTHWVKARKENLDQKPHISCQAYLAQLEAL